MLPAGSLVNFNLLHMHNNEQYFPNPKQFDPSRFENRDTKQMNAYLPFSAGPRNCLGMASLFRHNFNFETPCLI